MGMFDGGLWSYLPEDQRKRALSRGLLNFAAQMLAAGAPSREPGGFARGLAGGLAGFGQSFSDAEEEAMRREMFDLRKGELESEQAKRAREEADAAAMQKATENYIAHADPAQQTYLKQLADMGLLDEQIKQGMKPDEAPKTTGGMMWVGPGPNDWAPIPHYAEQAAAIAAAGRQAPAPSEFDRLARAAGLMPGSPEYIAAAQKRLAGSGGIQITGYDEQGRPIISIGGPAGTTKLTEGQAKATQYLATARQAAASIDKAGDALLDPTGYIAGKFGVVGNYFKSDEYRQVEQDAVVFTEQYYRALTGAAAPEAEYQRMAKQVIPLPADDPGTLAKKKATRDAWLAAIEISAGPGAAQLQEPTQPSGDQAPAIGTIEDGYRFTGGDPSKPENWEKVQ